MLYIVMSTCFICYHGNRVFVWFPRRSAGTAHSLPSCQRSERPWGTDLCISPSTLMELTPPIVPAPVSPHDYHVTLMSLSLTTMHTNMLSQLLYPVVLYHVYYTTQEWFSIHVTIMWLSCVSRHLWSGWADPHTSTGGGSRMSWSESCWSWPGGGERTPWVTGVGREQQGTNHGIVPDKLLACSRTISLARK